MKKKTCKKYNNELASSIELYECYDTCDENGYIDQYKFDENIMISRHNIKGKRLKRLLGSYNMKCRSYNTKFHINILDKFSNKYCNGRNSVWCLDDFEIKPTESYKIAACTYIINNNDPDLVFSIIHAH